MKLFQGKQEDYRKNLVCMEEVTDRLLGHMKGHGFSFRQEITDSKGDFSQEKLCGLVEELVERWAETLRESTDTNPGTGESLAEPYIREPTRTDEGTAFPLTVPEGCLFLMGDNRNDSEDSRSSSLGPVDSRCVLGRAALLAVPGKTEETRREWSRMGRLD